MAPEIDPKIFGTFEKQVPGPPTSLSRLSGRASELENNFDSCKENQEIFPSTQ